MGLALRGDHAGPAHHDQPLVPARRPLARYDFLFLAALAVKVRFTFRPTFEEPPAYHASGTVMRCSDQRRLVEASRASASTSPAPLFTGFMYSCIGSYICRSGACSAEFTQHPPLWAHAPSSLAVYVNFFAHHYVWDFRPSVRGRGGLIARTRIYFTVWQKPRSFHRSSACSWSPFSSGWPRAWHGDQDNHPSQRTAGRWPGRRSRLLVPFLIISYTLVALISRGGQVRSHPRGGW
jgi:hypothetical protein